MEAILRRIVIAAAIALAVLYAADYLVLRIRMARGGSDAALGKVTVLIGTPLKDGRISVFTDQPEIDTCARSLFPHMGYPPCWYASRHTTKLVN